MEIKTSTKYDDLLSEVQLESLKELRIALEKENAPYLEHVKNDTTLSALKRKEMIEKYYDEFNSFIEVKANEMLKGNVIRGQTKYWRAYDELGYVSTKPYSAEILSSTSYNEVLTLDDITKIDVLRDKLKEEYKDRLHDFAVIEEINAQCESLARKIHLERIALSIKTNKSKFDLLNNHEPTQPDGLPISKLRIDFYECVGLFKHHLPNYLAEEITNYSVLGDFLKELSMTLSDDVLITIIRNVFIQHYIESQLKWIVKDKSPRSDLVLDSIYSHLNNTSNISLDVFKHCCVVAASASINDLIDVVLTTGWELIAIKEHGSYLDIVNYGDYRIHAFETLTVEEEDKKWPLGRHILSVRGK